MKKLIFTICCYLLLALSSFAQEYQEYSAGVRFGDPFGLTFKRFLNANNTIEFNIGYMHQIINKNWPEQKFESWFMQEYAGFYAGKYEKHTGTPPVAVQLHYLRQQHIKKEYAHDQSGLAWYFGGGVQFRYQGYFYHFTTKLRENSEWSNRTHRVDDVDLGIDAVLGLEYTFYNTPIALFLDGTLFMELTDEPFKLWPLPGIGIRYKWD